MNCDDKVYSNVNILSTTVLNVITILLKHLLPAPWVPDCVPAHGLDVEIGDLIEDAGHLTALVRVKHPENRLVSHELGSFFKILTVQLLAVQCRPGEG